MVKSNWKWYPIIGAGTCLLITIIYFYLIFNIKTSVPPSSTDGLKYIVSSFISIVNGGIGYVVSLFLGNIFERTISKKYSDKFIKKSNFILSVIITILFCSILIPYTVKSYNSEKQLIHEWDVKNHLGVKLNTGKIIKVAIRLDEISKDTNQKNESHLLTSESEHGSFLLNGVKYQIKFKSPDIFLHDSDGNTFLKYSLQGYPYITELSYLPIVDEKGVSYLVLLSKLRSTSKRSVLSVFSKDAKILYEELITKSNILETTFTSNEGKVIITGSKQPVYNSTPEITYSSSAYKLIP